ncbi:hypothetical protein GE061_018029 [Apolygus lucorum]|uniref:Protein kintoun n=1 Tax=Apolygus lucorum TaxID=248454 RepID=A0A8S9XCU1_APOLU|nr:hypothetical protein GE061_018029 [Apolygus lucorum]
MEISEEKVEILVYDVLFHPMALDLAHRKPEFKKLVNDTAMTAVEDGDKVKLDRRNARVVKSTFVGGKFPCLLRKKSEMEKRSDVWEMPGYPYPPIEKDVAPVVKEITDRKEDGRYTTPNHVIKERKGSDISEYRMSKDAKMMAAIPEELVIEIPLPLLRSATDATLDVREKHLSLKSEKPAKYKLDITLPYCVDDDNGTARFDKDRKILTVTLPVRRKKYDHDFHREDSGIDSDVTHNDVSNRSSSEEELNSACNLDDDETSTTELIERLSEEVKEEFLDSSRAYTVPYSTVTMRSDKCFIVLHVKNIDPASVNHQFWSADGVWIKFSSLGAGGMFPTHHAVCLQVPRGLAIDKRSLRIEVWDNNMICSLKIHPSSIESSSQAGQREGRNDKCLIGLDPTQLSEAKVIREHDEVSEDEHEDSDDEDDDFRGQRLENSKESLSKQFHESLKLEENKDLAVDDDVFDEHVETARCPNNSEDASEFVNLPVESGKPGKTDASSDDLQGKVRPALQKSSSHEQIPKNKEKRENKKLNQKARTLSESSVPVSDCGKRSILKGSRSLSECHADESGGVDWSSHESSESHDDQGNPKKTVRFSDVVSKKIFRANSSILGQKRKNEKKRSRRKAAERRASESEPETEGDDVSNSMSETSEVSDLSTDVSAESSDDNSTPQQTAESVKHHRRRGSKNRRKNAATAKQNYLLNRDL